MSKVRTTVDYAALATSAPVDKKAALVRDGQSRDDYRRPPKAGSGSPKHWKAPPPTIPFPKMNMKGGYEDLTGRTFGLFRVMGFLGDKQWLVKCKCGCYEARSRKAINNPANSAIDRCIDCRHVVFLRRDDYKRRTGKDAKIEDFL